MPIVLTVQKTVEIPLLQFTDKVVDIPVVEQVAIAEVEIGTTLPAKSAAPIFVSAACQWIGFHSSAIEHTATMRRVVADLLMSQT